MNQSEARAACRANYTDLVTVYSDEDNTALINLTNLTGGSGALIGLNRGQSSDKWSNGNDVTFSNLTGVCGSGSCCAAMKADGSWESLNCTDNRSFMCYKRALIHVSAEQMDWASALDYGQRENRRAILRIESDLDQKEVGFELRRRRVSGPLWVGLGQSGLSELLKSSSRLSLGAWTKRSEGLRPSAVPGPTLWRKHSGRRRTFQLLELFVNLKNRRGAISDPRSGQFTVL
ncbi:hypothetical protein MHYP_G00264570 [Metynnis hypsauchen]